MLFTLCIPPLIGILAVRSLHKLLQLLLKALIIGRGCKLTKFYGYFSLLHRRWRSHSRFRLFLLLLNSLDGKVNFALFINAEDLNLYLLSHLKMVVHVLYKGVRYFGNMNQTAFSTGQRYKCAEVHNTGNFTLQNTAYFNCQF